MTGVRILAIPPSWLAAAVKRWREWPIIDGDESLRPPPELDRWLPARQLPTRDRVAVIGSVPISSRSTLNWRLVMLVVVCLRADLFRGALLAEMEFSDEDDEADEADKLEGEVDEVGEEEEDDGDPFEEEEAEGPPPFVCCLLLVGLVLDDEFGSAWLIMTSSWALRFCCALLGATGLRWPLATLSSTANSSLLVGNPLISSIWGKPL